MTNKREASQFVHDIPLEQADLTKLKLWPGNSGRGVVTDYNESMRDNGMPSPVLIGG